MWSDIDLGRRCSRSRRGFSLVELMIVIAIAGILVSLAVPVFRQYQYRSRTAEVFTNLDGMLKAQRAFNASMDNFANITAWEGNTALLPAGASWGSAACDPACSRANTDACLQFSCIGFQVIGRVYYRYYSPHKLAAPASDAEFCIGAQADLDQNGTPGEYEFQSDEGKSGAGALDCALTTCPLGIEPWETMNCRLSEY